MPEIPIDSLDDPRLDPYRDLRNTPRIASETAWLIAEGEKLTRRLLESHCVTASILCTSAGLQRLREQTTIPDTVPVYVTTTPCISQLIGFQFHRGVLGCGIRPPELDMAALLRAIPLAEPALLVACPEIKDPENLGTIIRTAAAFGAGGLIAGRAGTDPFSRRVLRTSMGSALRLPLVQTDDWPHVLNALHAAEFETVAAILSDTAEPLTQATVPRRVAVFLGNEAEGLPDSIVATCKRKVTLPMAAGVDSLNVAVAGGIFLHHFQPAHCRPRR